MLFGYRRDELLGRPVELLVPDREQFFAAPEVQPMGFGHDLFARRKDGTEIPVEIWLNPLRTARGLFTLATIVDLTERRRAEDGLRESRRELQLLTGRLLEAQEVERKRIARELHDDVNQSLALLAMEMDLLAGSPPRTPAETGDRIRALTDRIKELSSSIHNLSHQLHPAKLEQLGLVAAVRGLCKELGQSHDLDVKFSHYPELGAIPPDAALCLYRIVQEALRNVVKHSGSRHAVVELRGTEDAVALSITDDGIGFDIGASNGGLGLISMRERLNTIGGEINIHSRPSGGTRIDVRVPTPNAPRPEACLATQASYE
jgi:signal transduction histidine kinase